MRPSLEHVPRAGGGLVNAVHTRPARFATSYHYHPEIEITLILRHCGLHVVGAAAESFEPGDLMVFGPSTPHAYRSEPEEQPGNALACVVQFGRGAVWGRFADLEEAREARAFWMAFEGAAQVEGNAARALGRQVERVVARSGWKRLVALLELLEGIGASSSLRALPGAGRWPGATMPKERKIAAICQRLVERCDEPLGLEEAAAASGMSVSTFSRRFKKVTRRTFGQFRSEIRLAMAARQLRETDRTVLDIALASGYGNLSNFNRRFKRAYGHSPIEYRRYTRREA